MSEKAKTVYLAGKITGDPHYASKFADAAETLREAGYLVLSPAVLPKGFQHKQYMQVTRAMLEICNYACFLAGWEDSKGAREEYRFAETLDKRIFMFEDFMADGKARMEAEGVRHGRWKDGFCSKCSRPALCVRYAKGTEVRVESRWCPNCGAKMDGNEIGRSIQDDNYKPDR